MSKCRNRDLATQYRGGQRNAGGVVDIGPGPAELGVGRNPDEDIEITPLSPDVPIGDLASGRRVARAINPEAHAILHTRGDLHVDGLLLPHNSVARARPTRGAPGDGRAAAAACTARRCHLEPALGEVHPRARPSADPARRACRPGLHTIPGACATRNVGVYRDLLVSTHGGVHEGYVRLYLDIIAHEYLLLEWVPALLPATERPATSRKGGEDVVKVEAATEAAAATAEAGEGVRASEWVAAHTGPGVRIESGGAKLVILLALLRVGEELVGRLDLAELVFRGRVLVRVRVELLGEAVVCLLDLAGSRTLVDAKDLVGVLLGEPGIGRVERLNSRRVSGCGDKGGREVGCGVVLYLLASKWSPFSRPAAASGGRAERLRCAWIGGHDGWCPARAVAWQLGRLCSGSAAGEAARPS